MIDSSAVVVEAVRSDRTFLRRARPVLHFLDLGGVGVRDLTRDGGTMLILAGPVTSADAPFALHQWRPRYSTRIHEPALIHSFPGNGERPEGISVMEREGRKGVLVVYDGPGDRIDRTRYRADWIALPAAGGARGTGVSSRSSGT